MINEHDQQGTVALSDQQALALATLRRDLETYRLKAEALNRAVLAAY